MSQIGLKQKLDRSKQVEAGLDRFGYVKTGLGRFERGLDSFRQMDGLTDGQMGGRTGGLKDVKTCLELSRQVVVSRIDEAGCDWKRLDVSRCVQTFGRVSTRLDTSRRIATCLGISSIL